MSDFSLDDLYGDRLPQSGDRLHILSPEEYELLWGFPRFTQNDRDLFVTLTAPEREAIEQRRSVRTKIHFLLHLGYFRARQRVFRFELPVVRDDVDYLRRRYFDNQAVIDLTVSDHTRKRHVETILGLFRYRLCALEERAMLEAHARQATRVSGRPVYVLRELVDLLRRERAVLPKSGCSSCVDISPATVPWTKGPSNGRRSTGSWRRSNATCNRCCASSHCRGRRQTPRCWKPSEP